MDPRAEGRQEAALHDYVRGDTSEPVVLSVFRDVGAEDRARLLRRLRGDLRAIDGARLLILESMLLRFEHRSM